MVVVATGGRANPHGILVVTIGDDGRVSQYEAGDSESFEQLKLVSLGHSAVLVGQSIYGEMSAWRLTRERVLDQSLWIESVPLTSQSPKAPFCFSARRLLTPLSNQPFD